MLTPRKLYRLHYLLLIFMTISIVSCSTLDMLKPAEPPKNFTAVLIDCKNLSGDADSLEDAPPELILFVVQKPYLFKSHTNTLQDFALREGETRYGVLSYYSYSLAHKQVITDKIELVKNAAFVILFLKKQNETIAKEIIKVIPKKTRAINVELIGKKIKITKNT